MYNDLKENWSYNEWPDVDLNGNVIEKRSLKESVGISPKRRRVVVDGQEEFDGSKFVKDLNEDDFDEALNTDKKYGKPDLSKYKDSKDIIKPDISTKEKVCPDCGKAVCECGELKECGEVNEDLLNAKVSSERGRVIVDGQTDFDGSKFVKDLNEAKKADKPENIKDCLIAALDEIEVPEDEELDPKKVLDAIADCLDDEAREYLCGILCPEEKEEEVAEEEPVEVEVEEEPADDAEEVVEESINEDQSSSSLDDELALLPRACFTVEDKKTGEEISRENISGKEALDSILDFISNHDSSDIEVWLGDNSRFEKSDVVVSIVDEATADSPTYGGSHGRNYYGGDGSSTNGFPVIEKTILNALGLDSSYIREDLTPAEQKEKETIEGPMGVVRHKDEARYNELVALEKDHSRKV